MVLSLITSYVRFERLTRQLELDHRAMDPHDAFQLAISKALGTAHRLPDPFCVFVVRAGDSDDEARATADLLRKSLRSEDGVFVLTGQRLGLLVHARRKHAETIYHRLAAALSSAPTPHRLSAGIASCPENGERVMDLLGAAETALEQVSSSDARGFSLVAQPTTTESSDPVETGPADPRYTDPLTGLLRPEHLETAVQKYMAARRRRNLPVSLLLIDVDHLERYNSHYGREAGDAILRAIGGIIEKGFRETDLTARLGGEEFLVAVGCTPSDALKAGLRLVASVKRATMVVGHEILRVTIKVGVAGFPDHGGHPRFLLEKADLALSVARERGGNTCVLYERSMRAPIRASHPDRF